ncbi:Dynactin subunit 4 [Lamellibrachia satsuma]|nr:Dynactin subunit 4 [Lamellibrachia satsuma]
MATYMDVGRVQYVVEPGLKAPLSKLYFCVHCLKLKSSDCVLHEVDSNYCPNCLENVTSGEAKLRRNKCSNCFDCPSCGNTLSTRATSIPVTTTDQEGTPKSAAKKVFYLACGFCRWTSRDVGIPDQTTASGCWPVQENLQVKQISTLLEYYRQLAQCEKADREKKKHTRRRSYLQLSDRYGLGAVASRRRSALMSMASLNLKEGEYMKVPDAPVCVGREDVMPLPDDVYTKPFSLTDVTTIGQRLASVESQPSEVSGLYPNHKHLLIKRSQRCKECEHKLSKPEYNPSSIKFKIQLVGLHHVPEIRMMSIPALEFHKEAAVVLTLFNPLDIVTSVTLLPVDLQLDNWSTAQVVLPSCELVLAARDDAAEFDDGREQQNFKDDPSVVVLRKANKLGFIVKVTPQSEMADVKVSAHFSSMSQYFVFGGLSVSCIKS